jgi:hypothetical protein
MRKKRLPLFAALVTIVAVAMAIAASTALADGTIEWDGQGTSIVDGHRVLNTQKCGADDPFGPGVEYIQWNFTGASAVTSATLTINGSDVYLYPGPNSDKNGGTIKFFTPFYNLDTVTAVIAYVGTISNSQFTISHGCGGGKFQPDLTTEAATDGEGQAGDTLTDTAFLTGGSTDPVMGGTVDFALYNLDDDPDCEGTPIFTDLDVPVTGEADGTADVTSDGYVVLEKGTYSWVASYSGDDNNDPAGPNDCGEDSETLTFDAAAPTVVTEIHLEGEGDTESVIVAPYEVALGSTVHDKGTVTGPAALGIPTGDVDFEFWKGDDCVGDEDEAPPVQVGVLSNVDLDANGVAHPSASFGPLGAGSYFFTAHFNTGDENKWEDGDAICEPLTVNKGDLDIVTYIHNAAHGVVTEVPVGGTVHDTATFSGAVAGIAPDPDAVGFAWYTTIDCTGEGTLKSNTGEDEDSGDPRSEAVGPLASGAYSFRARFAGDDNYNAVPGSDVACEPLSVRTFGKTQGFWGNRNGQALISAGFTYTLGSSPSGCYINVTKTNSKTILPNTLNGVSILQNCQTAGLRDPNISVGSINNLLSQTLALKLNIDFITGFSGQTLGAMGCTPVGTLTSGSTVNAVLAYANELIGNLKLGGTVVTQQQVGDLNGLLGGCVNTEA